MPISSRPINLCNSWRKKYDELTSTRLGLFLIVKNVAVEFDYSTRMFQVAFIIFVVTGPLYYIYLLVVATARGYPSLLTMGPFVATCVSFLTMLSVCFSLCLDLTDSDW